MRRVVVLVFLLLAAAPARPARADIASDIYGDIRDVVEDLIQSEVTTSVVAQLKTKSPALGFYMHGTLERLASPYWGSLGRTLKSDLTTAVADFVYWHMSTGGGDGDILGSAKRFFHCSIDRDAASRPECARLLAAIVTQNRSLLEVECRRTKPKLDRRIACDLGLAVHAALERRGEVRHHLVDALADIVLRELPDRALADRARDVLARWLEFKQQQGDQPNPFFEVLGNPNAGAQLSETAIEQLCTTDIVKTRTDLMNDPFESPAWICFAVSHKSLPAALAATLTIEGHAPVQLDYWVLEQALKDLDTERLNDDASVKLFVDMALEQSEAAGKLAPGTKITLAWMGKSYTGEVGKLGALDSKGSASHLGAVIHRFKKALKRIAELRALVPASLQPYLFYPGGASPNTTKVLRVVHRMARLVAELRTRWYLWQADAKADPTAKGAMDDLDIAELLHVARASLDETDVGASDVGRALAFLDQHGTGSGSLDIGDWLRFVMRGDYRSLAMETLRAALDVRLDDPQHKPKPAETFFLTLASYLLDAGDGVGETVARSAFRASAKELLLSQQHKGVPRHDDRVRWNWYLPRLSLRLSFNKAYDAEEHDTRRTIVAAEFPTLMFAITDYVGLELSALDVVAPLGEMALRPAGAYHEQQYVLLDAVRPRAGLWIAMPQVTKRAALTIGVGARFLGIHRNDDGSDPLKLDITYSARTSLAFDAGIEFVF